MRVKIGNYTSWFGPYQLASVLCFWAKPVADEYGFKSEPDWVHNFGEWLAHGNVEPESKVGDITVLFDETRKTTRLYNLLTWIHSKKSRTIKVHIDRWDTWSADNTLSHIILPLLKRLQIEKQGSPLVDDSDVPEHLRSTSAPKKEDEWSTDDYFHLRWEYVLKEMIFAFESNLDDGWKDQFYSGNYNFQMKKLESGNSEMIRGEDDTSKTDFDGIELYQARISKGFILFGKYYEGLWT